MSELVWVVKGGSFHLSEKQKNTFKKLEPAVYELEPNMFGFHLTPLSEKFDFPYKIYGLETDLVKRVLKYYFKTDSGNLGILLNGVKGTGKTVTSKILCNSLNLPVIVVPRHMENAHTFINAIPQDVVVFVDEYEKIYKESNELLTIMDGALNAPYRRVFLMTTNNLYVDTNLIDRPSRVRYLKTFGNLSPDVVEEIVDDLLINKKFKDDCITFASTLEIITVDIVKSIINEINIQEESPLNFKNIFNASTRKGKYKLFIDVNGQLEPFMKGVKISPRINFGDHSINSGFYINDSYIGRIQEVIDFNTIKVEVEEYEIEEDETEKNSDSDSLISEIDSLNELVKRSSNTKQTSGAKRRVPRNKKKEIKTKMVTPFHLPKGEVIITVQDDYSFNDVYKYGKGSYTSGYNYDYDF